MRVNLRRIACRWVNGGCRTGACPAGRSLVLLLVLLVGCSGDGGDDAARRTTPRPAEVTLDPELRDELVAMMAEDQEERTGGGTIEDEPRTARLKEIIEEHGWPGYDLVGEEGEDAAWALAQHADLDPEFQQQALELLRDAVAEGQASPGNLAYLEDRVAVAQGQPQLYGTQMGCRKKGPVAGHADRGPGRARRASRGGGPPAPRRVRRRDGRGLRDALAA